MAAVKSGSNWGSNPRPLVERKGALILGPVRPSDGGLPKGPAGLCQGGGTNLLTIVVGLQVLQRRDGFVVDQPAKFGRNGEKILSQVRIYETKIQLSPNKSSAGLRKSSVSSLERVFLRGGMAKAKPGRQETG